MKTMGGKDLVKRLQRGLGTCFLAFCGAAQFQLLLNLDYSATSFPGPRLFSLALHKNSYTSIKV